MQVAGRFPVGIEALKIPWGTRSGCPAVHRYAESIHRQSTANRHRCVWGDHRYTRWIARFRNSSTIYG